MCVWDTVFFFWSHLILGVNLSPSCTRALPSSSRAFFTIVRLYLPIKKSWDQIHQKNLFPIDININFKFLYVTRSIYVESASWSEKNQSRFAQQVSAINWALEISSDEDEAEEPRVTMRQKWSGAKRYWSRFTWAINFSIIKKENRLVSLMG
jgi:hypothetical protein